MTNQHFNIPYNVIYLLKLIWFYDNFIHCNVIHISLSRLYGEDTVDPLNIVITQPRRIGATSLAKRVAKEVGEPEVGGLVGYKIGQEQVCGELTQICYVTSGYLIEVGHILICIECRFIIPKVNAL